MHFATEHCGHRFFVKTTTLFTLHKEQMTCWRRVPNFIISCLGQFAENRDILCYSLNSHWYSVFRTCISCFEHVSVNIRSYPHFDHLSAKIGPPREDQSKCTTTEYLVVRGLICIEPWRGDYGRLAQFQRLRHLTIVQDKYRGAISQADWTDLCNTVYQLPQLKTITLNAINGATLGNHDLMHLLPRKVTSININREEDLASLKVHFPQLLQCDPPWQSAVIEEYCEKMPNLTSLVFDGIPGSFHLFTLMKQLKSLTWHLSTITLEQWNQFASAVSPTLQQLHIESAHFDTTILRSEGALSLPSLTTFYLNSSHEHDLQWELKRIMPQLRHFYLHFAPLKFYIDVEWLYAYMPKYAVQNQLLTFTAFFADATMKITRITYYKGDKDVARTLYGDEYIFGIF